MKLKARPVRGLNYACPEIYCQYRTISAKNFYDHLKHVHNFFEFGEKK